MIELNAVSRRPAAPAARLLTAAVLCLIGLLPAPGTAAEVDHKRELAACLKLAEAKPDQAFDSAMTWQDRGGGDRAGLCQAMALFHRGQFAAAGLRLEELAPKLGGDNPKAVASLFGRAGWAWMRANDAQRAERLYTAALERQPGDVDLLIDRAFARVEAKKFQGAVDDLTLVVKRAPKRAEGYLYRAGAYRGLEKHDLALADVAKALELKPNDPEALLLRGNLRALKGEVAAARDDWRSVTRLDPDTTTARAAATNLARHETAGGKDKDKDKAKPKK